ncbi:MAG: nitroreductase family protein, partial [Paracoccaceae bacterium]
MTYQPIPLPDRSHLTAQEAEELSAAYLAHMRRRHSVRHFDTAPISDVLLTNAISVAASAPSGANQQPWHFVIVKNPEMKMKIRLA